MYTDANDVHECVASSEDVRTHFVIIQAKAVNNFQADVFTKMGTNRHQIFGDDQLTFSASDRVKNLHSRNLSSLTTQNLRRRGRAMAQCNSAGQGHVRRPPAS